MFNNSKMTFQASAQTKASKSFEKAEEQTVRGRYTNPFR